jgi:hypothetical protein
VTANLYPSVPAADYHADNTAEGPTLSASIANILLTSSPRHAWTKHPRLNPDFVATADEKFDVGTICHSLLLEGPSAVEIIDAPDYRTKWAQEARELARSHGRVPLLGKQYDNVKSMVAAVAAQIERLELDPRPLTDGAPEQTMVWDEQGVMCRARIDWLHTNGDVCDLKTTSRLAVGWDRGPLFDHGCDVQAALYSRGLVTLTGRAPGWTWLVVETSPPYGLIPYKLSAPVLAIGDAKVNMALAIWRECLERDEWPLYPPTAVEAELPPWIESRWLAREAREEVVA